MAHEVTVCLLQHGLQHTGTKIECETI